MSSATFLEISQHLMVEPEGFEPAIKTLEGRSSRKFYLLNGMVELRGLEL
jgi:hypothetical protein